MATMTVKDAAGANVDIEKPSTPGRAAAAASRPVALSTEDLAALTAVGTKLDGLSGLVDGMEALAAATNAALATLAGYLDGVEGGLGTLSGKLDLVPTTLPRTGAATIMDCETAAAGATWAVFANQACTCLSLVNNSGQDLEYRRGGAGKALPLLNRMAYLVVGITNANQVSIRRIDQSNTQVTLSAEALG